jgi:hypothetical protein
VLRKAPGKTKAAIYDIVALPPFRNSGLYEDNELEMISREFDRVRAFAKDASNYGDVSNKIEKISELYFKET